MYTTSLRKVGGSVMMAVPPALLDLLELEAGSVVGLDVDGKRLIVQPEKTPRYTLEELLSQCDPEAPDDRDREWLEVERVGREL